MVASAYRIDASPSGVSFVFLANQKNAKAQCEEQKAWLQSLAEKVAGKPVPVSVVVAEGSASAREHSGEPRREEPAAQKSSPEALKAEAMANSTVQAVLEIFPVEKTTIEER